MPLCLIKPASCLVSRVYGPNAPAAFWGINISPLIHVFAYFSIYAMLIEYYGDTQFVRPSNANEKFLVDVAFYISNKRHLRLESHRTFIHGLSLH